MPKQIKFLSALVPCNAPVKNTVSCKMIVMKTLLFFTNLSYACKASPFVAVTCLLVLSGPVHAQINKGRWMLGGNAAFSYATARAYGATQKQTSISLSPAAGYFIIDKMAAGLRLDGNYTAVHYINGGRYRITDIAVAPFVRYYFLEKDRQLNLFADAGLGWLFGKYKDPDYPQYASAYHATVFSFRAGPAIFINQHTALEITAGYNYSTRGPIDTAITNTIQIGIGLQIHLGK